MQRGAQVRASTARMEARRAKRKSHQKSMTDGFLHERVSWYETMSPQHQDWHQEQISYVR
jgi:hypothetical protein